AVVPLFDPRPRPSGLDGLGRPCQVLSLAPGRHHRPAQPSRRRAERDPQRVGGEELRRAPTGCHRPSVERVP
ncbi:hypothetical protein ABTL75_21160, partial [Acinetobacter baumannii]